MAKIFYIDWLNKCRKCGAKDAEVSTVKGSRTALWDGDYVKCRKCGLTGEVEVCEWQAICLWSDIDTGIADQSKLEIKGGE